MAGKLAFQGGGFVLQFESPKSASSGKGYQPSYSITVTASKKVDIQNPAYQNLDQWDQDTLNKFQKAVQGILPKTMLY